MYLGTPLKQCGVLSQGKKSIIYVWMWDNFANILRKLVEKSLSKISCYVLLLARENLKLKNSYILAKTWLSAPKITRPKKLQHYFPIIINIFLYHGHKKQEKNQKYFKFSLAYIRDLNLPPIRFVQFVPRFVPRCRLYSFIISMGILFFSPSPFLVVSCRE